MLKKIIPIIIMLFIALFVYREGIFKSDTILFSSDYHTSVVTWQQKALADSADGSIWYRDYLAGWPEQVMPYNVLRLVFRLFDPYTALTLAYFLATFLTGVFFYLFLRSTGISRYAALFGGVSLMLSNNFLTLVFPGHLEKFMTFIWIPLVFLFLRKAVLENAWTKYIYAGFFLALALQGLFYEVVIFFTALAACYWLYLILQKRQAGSAFMEYYRSQWKNVLYHKLGFFALILIMLILCAQLLPKMFALSANTEAQQESSQAKWDFATSWSLPPEETLELFVPGVFGWKSGDRDLPYWGRMGKPAVPSGLKLNAENVGVATLFLTVLAFLILRKKRGSEVSFWLWVVVITLLFSYGRHFPPLYWLFYQLPYMDTIRNPNKILWLTLFAFSVLGALGMHALFSEEMRKKYQEGFTRFLKIGKYLLFAFGIAVPVSFIASGALRGIISERIGRNTDAVTNLLEHIPTAFLIAAVFAALAYGMIWLVLQGKVKGKDLKFITAGLIALVAFDLWLSGRHFIVYSERENTLDYHGALAVTLHRDGQLSGLYFDRSRPDPVVAFLKETMANPSGEGRVYVRLDYITVFYFRHYFPYHEIACANFNPNPRMPERYQDFMRVTGFGMHEPPLEALAQFGVRYILSLEQSSQTNEALPLLASFPLLTREKIPLPLEFRIYELTNSLPRAWVARQYREVGNKQESIRLLASSSLEDSLLSPIIETGAKGISAALPPAQDEADRAQTVANAAITFTHHGHGRAELIVHTEAPGLLVLLDAWHKDWGVRVNGEPCTMYPANLLFRAVKVPEGESTVVFEYKQPPLFTGMTYAGYFLVFSLALVEGILFLRKRKTRRLE
jgi:hypothetical protein